MQENEILVKEQLNEVVVKFVIYKPLIARAAKAGQFVILRGREGGERVPVTLVDWDEKQGTITVIIQSIGKSTFMFNSLKQGDSFLNILGPLGTAVEIKKYGTVTVIGGVVGLDRQPLFFCRNDHPSFLVLHPMRLDKPNQTESYIIPR